MDYCNHIIINMTKKFDKQILHMLYLEIWKERQILGRNYSAVSMEMLPQEINAVFFDHLLEKNMYPQFIYEKRNIILVTAEEQELRTNAHPKKRHRELIEKAKNELL